MRWLGELWRRLLFRLRGERFGADLAEEMQLHLDLRAADKQTRGMVPADAEVAARRQFGNVTRLQEASREAWGWSFFDTVGQDVRYGLRTLATNKGFTAIAILSLALGIGANTAVFSILNAAMLRTLPVKDPDRLVQVKIGENAIFTNPLWEQVRDHQQALAGIVAFGTERFDLSQGGESQFINGLLVSGNYFRVLKVLPVVGRVFTPEDDRPGSAGIAVISHGLWQRHFHAAPDIVGETIRLNRVPFEIVGVTPSWFGGFDVDRDFDVAVPIASDPLLRPDWKRLEHRSSWWLRVLGRLRPQQSITQTRDRLNSIAPEVFKATLPEHWKPDMQARYLGNSFEVTPAASGYSAAGTHYRTALYTVMAIVALVLLIACANIANLLLSRAAARQRELSMRLAIGASRSRVIRQLLTESLLLSLLGSVFGLVLALLGSRLLVSMMSTRMMPLDLDLSPDLGVLAFTTGVACLTALLFGLAPALRATQIGLNQVLKENARGALPGSTRFHLGKALVAVQVALSLVLLVGAALFLGSLRNLLAVELGFNPANVLFIVANSEQSIPEEQRAGVYREIMDRLRALPGVGSAATVDILPLSGSVWNYEMIPEGRTTPGPDTLTYFNRVSPGYFETVGTPLLLGRDFDARDAGNSPKVVIIGEKTAKDFFGSENPIGKTIAQEMPNSKEIFRVIGVVKDIKYRDVQEETRLTAYFPANQGEVPGPRITYAVRYTGSTDAMVAATQATFAQVHPEISLEFRRFETQVNESLMQPRVVALLSAVFGLLALLLAMVGLYGITAYGVAGRQGEIGIRMALGAQTWSVVWLVLRDVLLLLAAGIALGLAASAALGKLVASLLFGVPPNDIGHLMLAVAVLAGATAVAAYLPARRAAHLDPMTALREE